MTWRDLRVSTVGVVETGTRFFGGGTVFMRGRKNAEAALLDLGARSSRAGYKQTE